MKNKLTKTEQKKLVRIFKSINLPEKEKYLKENIELILRHPNLFKEQLIDWAMRISNDKKLERSDEIKLLDTVIRLYKIVHPEPRVMLAQQFNFREKGDAATEILNTVFASDEQLEQQILERIEERKRGEFNENLSELDKVFSPEIVYNERLEKKKSQEQIN